MVPKTINVSSLEAEENLRVQRISWKLERVGWVLCAIALALAAIGLFGGGPLSSATAKSADGAITLRYDRFARNGAPERLEVELQPSAFRDGEAKLWISRDFFAGVRIQQIVPQPESVELLPDRILYHFHSPGRSGSIQVVFDYTPGSIGQMKVTMGTEGGVESHFWQLVYP
jgi:hypothetical protein